jgi:hypothetical protein
MKTKRIIKGQKGGAVIEFAIVLPLLIMFVAGIIEFSLLFYNKQVISNASREAARAGINAEKMSQQTNPDLYLLSIVNTYCFGDGGSDGYNDEPRLITFGTAPSSFPVCGSPPCVEINDGSGYGGSLSDLKVSVQYVYNFLLPSYIGLGTSITFRGQTEMRKS